MFSTSVPIKNYYGIYSEYSDQGLLSLSVILNNILRFFFDKYENIVKNRKAGSKVGELIPALFRLDLNLKRVPFHKMLGGDTLGSAAQPVWLFHLENSASFMLLLRPTLC